MILRNSKTNLKANFVFAHGKNILEEGLSIFMIKKVEFIRKICGTLGRIFW